MAKRLQAMGQANYANGFEVTTHRHSLELPLKWRKRQTIFVNSMSDLFHSDVPVAFIQQVYDVMNRAKWHTFQVLTKRSSRLAALAPSLQWTENIWMGVTVEDAEYTNRIDDLRAVPAATRFLSLEPLLGRMGGIDLTDIDWVIVGGESGPGARPMQEEWVLDIRDQCQEAKVPFFFKQWGGANKKKNGRLLQGSEWNQTPMDKQTSHDFVSLHG